MERTNLTGPILPLRMSCHILFNCGSNRLENNIYTEKTEISGRCSQLNTEDVNQSFHQGWNFRRQTTN